jgi:hypothetical protein
MSRARSKVTNILGMLSLAALLVVWLLVLNPMKWNGEFPGAAPVLVLLAITSFLASVRGSRLWSLVFAATILTLVFVLFFYRPLFSH